MLISISQSITFNLSKASKNIEIIWENKNINKEIFNEKTAKTASKIASISSLRKSIVNIQRAFAKEPGLVAEGRDMGSIIFPDAIIKIFLKKIFYYFEIDHFLSFRTHLHDGRYHRF